MLAYHVAEIVRREEYLFREVSDRRQSLALRHRAFEIFVQQSLEPYDDVAVLLAAGRELAVVETQTIVEQHADMGRNQAAAVLVDRMFQFRCDLV